MSKPIFNVDYLDDACAGDASLRRELLELFVVQMEECRENLDSLFGQRAYLPLAAESHKVKATVLAMGMDEMAAVLKKLELVCKKKFLDEVDGGSLVGSYRLSEVEMVRGQINSLSGDMQEWINRNNFESVARDLINFCKLHSRLAGEEAMRLLAVPD